MNKTIRIFGLVVFFCLFGVYCSFSENIFMPQDPEVAELNMIYSAAGYTFPFAVYPLSNKELLNAAEDLLPKVEEKLIKDRLKNYITTIKSKNIKIMGSIYPIVAMDGYFRTEDAVPDLSRDFLSVPDLFNIKLGVRAIEIGGLGLQSGWKREFTTLPKSSFFESFPDKNNPIALENMTIQQGYLFLNPGPTFFLLGRAPMHFGSGRFNSLLPSKKLPFLDSLNYRIKFGIFQLSSYIATLENRAGIGEEVEIEGLAFGENTIIATMHRFDIIKKHFRFSLGSHSIVARKNNAFLIGDILPVFSWHNAAVGSHNLCIYGDVSVTVIPGFEFYLQIGLDEVNAGDLFGVADTELPTIDGYIAGVAFDKIFESFLFSAVGEFGYTHYLWGIYWTEDSPFGNYFDRAIYRLKTDGGYRILPLTSPYGPGTIWSTLKTNLDFTEIGLLIQINFHYLRENSQADLIRTEHLRQDEKMKAAPKIHNFLAEVKCSYNFRNIVSAHITPAYLYENGMSWFALSIGFDAGYPAQVNIEKNE